MPNPRSVPATVACSTLLLAGLALLLFGLPAVAAQEEEGQRVRTRSGLSYVDLEVGRGDEAKKGMRAVVHYTGWLSDGTQFDSSLETRKPFSFRIGKKQVIAGWEEGVIGMRVGGKRRLFIPSDLGYGAEGAGDEIPPHSDLVFEIQLLSVQKD